MQINKQIIPQTNYTKGREGKPISVVCLHWFGVGTLAGADARFKNPTSIVSAHYGISDDVVYQWVDEADTAYATGDWETNTKSINIEHDCTTTKNATEKTYQTAGKLLKEICTRHNIPLDRTHILKHSEVVATSCPGTLDIDRIIELAKGGSMLDTDIETAVEEQFGLKLISRYNKYWTYEELIADWVKLTKEVKNEQEQKEAYKKEATQYKETCTSQAEEIATLNKAIDSLSKANSEHRSEIAQLQAQFSDVSIERDGLLDACKGYENSLSKLKTENESLQDKLTSQNPLQIYTTGDILTELVNRIFGRKKVI